VGVKRSVSFCIVVLAVLLFSAGRADAHARLLHTNPPAGSIVAQAPSQVMLYFSEAVQLVHDRLHVLGPDGKRADAGTPVANGAQVALPLQAGEPNGTYLVTYRIISADGHPVSGSFSFSIGAPSAIVPGVSGGVGAAVDPVVSVLAPVARYVGYIGLALLVGPVLCALRLWPRRLPAPRALIWTGVVLIVVGTVAGVYLQAPYTTGSSLAGTTWDDVKQVLNDSRYGFTAQVRIAFLVAAVPFLRRVLAAATDRTERALLGALAAGGALTWSFSGHPGTTPVPVLTIGADAVHVLAMAVWLGGLLTLFVYLLPRGNEQELGALLPVWSRWAGWTVAALVIAGSIQAFIEIGTLSALLHTRYGQLVLIKIALLAVIVGVAWFSRRFALSARGEGVARPLRRLVLTEVIFIAVVLAVTTMLVQTTPAKTATAIPNEASGPPSVTLTSRYYRLQVDLEPGKVGENSLHMYAFTPDGKPITILEWKVTAALPSKDIPPTDANVLTISSDHAVAELALPISGVWQLRYTLRISEIDEDTVTQMVQIS
jgi:copper transport protein